MVSINVLFCESMSDFGVYIGQDYLGDVGDLDDEELTRDKVKRASTHLIQQSDKRKRKQPKGKDKTKSKGDGGDKEKD